MKLLLLLALLIPHFSYGANGSGNVSAVANLGGYNAVNGGLFIPESYIGATSGPSYFMISFGYFANTLNSGSAYVLYKNGVQYQVTAGKTAYCTALSDIFGTNTNPGFQLFSNTTSFASNTATGSLTGSQVYEFGSATQCGHYGSPTVYTPVNEQILYTFGATTYPGIISCATGAQAGIKLFCKEQ